MDVPFALADLLNGAGALSVPALEVEGINADSRAIIPGEAFFALPGTRVHGDGFAAQAVGRGASVMVSDRRPDADPGIPVVLVDAGDNGSRDVVLNFESTDGRTFTREVHRGDRFRGTGRFFIPLESLDSLELSKVSIKFDRLSEKTAAISLCNT